MEGSAPLPNIPKWKTAFVVKGEGWPRTKYSPFYKLETYREYKSRCHATGRSLTILQNKDRSRSEEETLRNFEALNGLLTASEDVLIDIYKELGPSFVTMAMTDMAKAQRETSKRLKEICISVVKSDEVAEKVRELSLIHI